MSTQYSPSERCPNDGGIARLMLDLEDETIPHLDQWGYPQYYCLRCGNIFAVGEKFTNPSAPQSVVEEAARQLLTAQPDMSTSDLAGRLQITPRAANKLARKIQGRD